MDRTLYEETIVENHRSYGGGNTVSDHGLCEFHPASTGQFNGSLSDEIAPTSCNEQSQFVAARMVVTQS